LGNPAYDESAEGGEESQGGECHPEGGELRVLNSDQEHKAGDQASRGTVAEVLDATELKPLRVPTLLVLLRPEKIARKPKNPPKRGSPE
jgi:hypothetical protein